MLPLTHELDGSSVLAELGTDHRPVVAGVGPDLGRRALAIRLASVLYLGSGVFAFVSLPTVPGADAQLVTVAVGAVSIAIGVAIAFAPWHRWPVTASFWLAPMALALLAVANTVGSREPFDYAVFFVVVHVWVGVAHRRWASLLLAPMTTVAYAVPLPALAIDDARALGTVFVVVPACVLVGEAVAWLVQALDSSEVTRRTLADALERERAALEDLSLANEQLQYLAFHDPVTGVANRAAFQEHLDVALARARRGHEPLLVCSIDLDKFKLVNDTLGHAAGDELLRQVTERLKTVTREGDVLARAGGDEFLLLLPASPTGDAIAPAVIAERIGRALEPAIRLGDMDVYVTGSIGTARFPGDATDRDSLLRVADAAMYREKRARSSIGVVESPSFDGNELELSSRLRVSVREQAWTLRYQPIVETVLGRTVGAEALIRWCDPVHGLRAPGEFLALAEELDLGPALTGWVLEELATVAGSWRDLGTLDDLTMLTMNLAPRELWHPALTERVGRLAEELARPELLVVEVTELALAMDVSRAASILGSLRERGVRIAVDDFGSGYSSLSRLRSLPIDILKIDRSFIDGIERERTARRVMRSIVRLAAGLGMVAIAEGIETEEQLDVAREEGCTLAQGFLFGPPVSADRFALELAEARPIAV